MKTLLQRVQSATVSVDDTVVGSCGKGLLIFAGFGHDDTPEIVEKLWKKIYALRMFADETGKTNCSLHDINGDVLIVSQFTLYADTHRGHRPSFVQAAPADTAKALYQQLIACAHRDLGTERVGTGIFGADMLVDIQNDGPFTLMLESD